MSNTEAMNDLCARDEGYRGIHAAVLGASGFIGRWVARSLCARGARIYLIVRDRVSAERIFAEYSVAGEIIELDLQQEEAVRGLYQKIKPSITFNLAGYGVDQAERDEGTAYHINARLPQTLCEVLAEKRDRNWSGQDIVHVGSALEYGEIGGNLSEDSAVNPTTLYGKSKLRGTELMARYCRKYSIKGVTARLFTVYGPGEHKGRLLPSLLETARTGNPLPMTDGTQKRDFTYVEDVAEGLLRLGLAKLKSGEVMNLATGRLTSVRDFAEISSEALRIPKDRFAFGAIPTRAEEMQHAEVAINRLRESLAWRPSTGIAEGIRRTGEFERALLRT
jgi:nucleoside-diphosphate-sugar epimerase